MTFKSAVKLNKKFDRRRFPIKTAEKLLRDIIHKPLSAVSVSVHEPNIDINLNLEIK